MNLTWIGAGATAALAFWGQLQGMLMRVKSYVIVSNQIDYQSGALFLKYCIEHYKYSKFGAKDYTIDKDFIKSINRVGLIPLEGVSRSATFFKGWAPIFVSGEQTNQASKVSITYIRGTFNFELELIKCCREHNEKNKDDLQNDHRYKTVKLFGSKKDYGNSYGSEGGMMKESPPTPHRIRILGYDETDIGSPNKKNPFSALGYTQEIEDAIEDIRKWKKSQKWYLERGLNWRLGMGLYGQPGNGKSSMVRAVGQELGLPIYSFDLATMDNNDFVSSWKTVLNDVPAVALIEDIDRVFDKDKNIKTNGISMDCILNAIGGVEPANGVLLFITANDTSKIDPALGIPDKTGKSSRPGRLDRTIIFREPDAEARKKIANQILSDWPDLIEKVIEEGNGESGAQFQSRCEKLALKEYWK